LPSGVGKRIAGGLPLYCAKGRRASLYFDRGVRLEGLEALEVVDFFDTEWFGAPESEASVTLAGAGSLEERHVYDECKHATIFKEVVYDGVGEECRNVLLPPAVLAVDALERKEAVVLVFLLGSFPPLRSKGLPIHVRRVPDNEVKIVVVEERGVAISNKLC